VYGKKLESLKDIEPIFRMAQHDLVIVAPSYSDDFLSVFIDNVQSGRISAALIGPCGASREAMDDNLVDIAKVTGATIVEGKLGKSIDTFSFDYFGSSESFTATAKKSNIIGGRGKEEDIAAHINSIKEIVAKGTNGTDEEAMSEYELKYYNERIASLSGGVAIIWIGGFSDAEVKEKKDRYDDAINAVRVAISDGILPGGGAGLLHAIKEVGDNHQPLENATQEKAFHTFLKVMEEPARTIIASTGKDPGYWTEKIKESNKTEFGFNAREETMCEDLYETGIIDPAKVEIMAIQFGTSLAGTFVTTDCIITSDAFNCGVKANDDIMDKERGLFDE
jgi:chaperonin GroEL